ncbi:MAG: PP2C family serine/threonine-protein phosphatase [Hyphomicrobiales bacterium]
MNSMYSLKEQILELRDDMNELCNDIDQVSTLLERMKSSYKNVNKTLDSLEKEILNTDGGTDEIFADIGDIPEGYTVTYDEEEGMKLSKIEEENTSSEEKEASDINDEDGNITKELVEEEEIRTIQLKNAQVNIPYSDVIVAEELQIPAGSEVTIEGIPELTWNADESIVSGLFHEAGDCCGDLIVKTTVSGQKEEERTDRIPIHVLVNPDPRSLWQNLEPSEDEMYKKEHIETSHIVADGFSITGASVRGKSHAHKGTFRDDHFLNHYWENNQWRLQAVADGAGSAKYSRQGSKVACETVQNKLSDFFASEEFSSFEEMLTKIFVDKDHSHGEDVSKLVYQLSVGIAFNAQQAVKKFAKDEGVELRQLATTLLFALSKKFAFGTIIIYFSVGDGAIGVVGDECTALLMEPDSGEYSGQTRFLTMDEIFQFKSHAEIRKRYGIKHIKENVDAILLMTDGVSDPKFETDNNLRDVEYWKNLWNELLPLYDEEQLTDALVQWMDFYSPGEYDDRTISILK